jgi:serine/threonine protein kinase
MYELQTIRWDDLKIGRELGKGSFATVYLGRWQGTEVAVKQLAVSQLPTDLRTDFEREAAIHAKCNASPRIARLYGIPKSPVILL